MTEYDAYRWAGIGHIFRSPFYYYAYSFSQLTVDSLYDVYEKKSIPDFENKMITMLSSGNVKKYKELLAEFKLDPLKPDFWQNGLNITIKMIDDFEKLVNEDVDIKAIVEKNNIINNSTTNQAANISAKQDVVVGEPKAVISVYPESRPVEAVNMVSDSTVVQEIKNKSDTKIDMQVMDPKDKTVIANESMTAEQIKKDSSTPMVVLSQDVKPAIPVSPINKNSDTIIVKLPK
jgi:hypothetical protein